MSNPTNPPHHPTDQQTQPRPQTDAPPPRPRMPRGPDQPIPEFLQRRAAEQAQQLNVQAPPRQRPRPPRETIVPVLDDHALGAEEAPGLSPFELNELEREITRAQTRPRRSLAPEMMPPPPLRPKAKVASEPMTGLFLRLGLVAFAVIFGLMLFLGKIPLPASWKTAASEPLKRLAALTRSAPAPIPAPLPQAALPKLIVEGADAGNNDEIGLGVKMSGRIEGVMAIVSGLVAGTKLSRGQPWGENEWFIPAAELSQTKLRPPAGFSGTMQYTVALKMPDAKIADRQTLRLQWSQTQNRESKLRELEPEEIATMLTRGQTMLENGDIAGARLLLQRAAEAGDQTAAMALAASFDPVVMKDLGVRGVEADVEKARYWYGKASQFGSKEAPKRLESLASQSR
jgi:hypothetical protein